MPSGRDEEDDDEGKILTFSLMPNNYRVNIEVCGGKKEEKKVKEKHHPIAAAHRHHHRRFPTWK